MSDSPAPSTHLPYIRSGRIYAVPSLHARWSFAALVRQAFLAVRPGAIAVELPSTLEASIRKGVERLPYLSAVVYQDFDSDLDRMHRVVPITPEDSLIEAVRLGLSGNVPVHFIDRDILHYEARPVRAPDDYLVRRIGLESYWRRVAANVSRPEPGSADEAREIAMASALRELTRGHERVLFVCGLAHLEGVLRHVEAGTPSPAGEVTQREQVLYNLSEQSVPRALQGIPYVVYGYELSRVGLAPPDYPPLIPLPLSRGGEFEAAKEARSETERQAVAEIRSRAIVSQVPDPYDALADLSQTSVTLYEREWRQRPSPARLATLLRFARNLALVARRLTPSKFQVLLAAKNTVNDDFAFQALRAADDYPFHDPESGLPELKMEEGKGEADGETITLRLRLPPSIRDNQDDEEGGLDLEAPPEEIEDGSWEERWEAGDHHVSHLPQDARLEEFFDYLRSKCRTLLADQRVRLHEFQASLMDGLDIRETLRNLALGKLYVKENLPAIGDVGPIVVIFHKPGEEERYPHEQMWYAEHGEESDLALYSTPPGLEFDGPGISRCHYGGVLSIVPATGRARVWGNPRYRSRSRAESLLRAAIDLSRKPIVGYAAARGPSPEMLALAASRGIHIMYVPLESLSADTLKRVQTFHVLADREVRPLAPLYIN
jgi:hypothetical protein